MHLPRDVIALSEVGRHDADATLALEAGLLLITQQAIELFGSSKGKTARCPLE